MQATRRLLKVQRVLCSLIAMAAMADASATVDTTGFVYTPITPCRIIDTRVTATPFAAKEARTFSTNAALAQGGGDCMVYPGTIPSALSLNVTVDATSLGNPDQVGFLSVLPVAGAGTSWMNFVGGETIANAGVAAINPADGTFSIKSQNPANVIVDVYGYWVPSPVQQGTGSSSATMGAFSNASGDRSTAMGLGALASGGNSTAMGSDTTASGGNSTAMGSSTVAAGNNSTAIGANTSAQGEDSIAMGAGTTASGTDSVAMGDGATASGIDSTAMGAGTVASGDDSTAMGFQTLADGKFSIALGDEGSSNGHVNTFVFADGSLAGSTKTVNTADKQFMVRASGGFVFYSSTNTTAGIQLAAGNSAWTTLSDRNAKDSVVPVDARTILDRVVALPLNTWHYKTQESQYRHMGAMAQDFYAAFHLGESDTGIDTIDADGVALAAIQGLNAKLNARLEDKNKEIASLQADLSEQKARVASLESLAARVALLEQAQTSRAVLVAAAQQ